MAKIAVLGCGGWGMALAIAARKGGNDVLLWSPFEQEVAGLLETRTNERLLNGVTLPEDIGITCDLSMVGDALITVIATPSVTVREVARKLAGVPHGNIVVSASKGIEKGTYKRLSQIIAEELPEVSVAALSGPSHAEEVARDIPTSLVAASGSLPTAQVVQDVMSNETLRIYTSEDIIGAELGGALKNIIAIAAGICDGLQLGDNSKAALITRGLAEMARLGACMGAREYTFFGLTGVGDLIVTCMSRHSRNNRFGRLVGSGVGVQEALRQVGTVEGYHAALAANGLAQSLHTEMPIVTECYQIMYENKDARKALDCLMNRPGRSEH